MENFIDGAPGVETGESLPESYHPYSIPPARVKVLVTVVTETTTSEVLCRAPGTQHCSLQSSLWCTMLCVP